MRLIDADKIAEGIKKDFCEDCDHDDCCYACAYVECLERLEKAEKSIKTNLLEDKT